MVVVVVDMGRNCGFKLPFEKLVFQQDAVFAGLMPPLDFTLSLWMHGRAANGLHALVLRIFRQIASDVRRATIAGQARFVHNLGAVAALCGQSDVDRVGDILGQHGAAKLPADDKMVNEMGHPKPWSRTVNAGPRLHSR